MERSTQLHQTAGSAEARDVEENCPNKCRENVGLVMESRTPQKPLPLLLMCF